MGAISANDRHRVAGPRIRRSCLRALEQVTIPVRLVLAGVEPDSDLGRLAEKAPSRHAVVCVPFTSQVRALYDLLELVLLPSHSEGLSQALLEAMALGKPVIASAATGNLEVMTDGLDGRLVDPTAPVAWARAIEALLSQPAEATRLERRCATHRAGDVLTRPDRGAHRRPLSVAAHIVLSLLRSRGAGQILSSLPDIGAPVVRVSGFTIVRNAIKLDFPVEASIRSMLPICDEVVVNLGRSEDETLDLVRSIADPKIRILESEWDMTRRE